MGRKIDIKSLIKKNDKGNLYILYSDIKKLNLSNTITKKIIITLRRKGIQIRSDLGEIHGIHLGVDEYIDNCLLDEKFLPKIATIKKDSHRKSVYDFCELEKYIEEKLIQKYLINDKDEILEGLYRGYIKLTDIIRFNFNYEEIKFIFNYLDKKQIMVRGNSKIFEGEFINYRYVERKKYNILKSSKELSEKEQNELLKQYNMAKDEKIKEELALANIKLVNYILSKIKIKYGINPNDYFSYGCEGLLEAIRDFNPNCGVKFITFAYTYIKNAIFNGIRENALYIKTLYLNYYRARSLVERNYDISLENNLDLVDDVIDLMFGYKKISLKVRENYRKKILANLNFDIDNYLDFVLIDYSEIYTGIDYEILIKKIGKVLSILNENQKEVLILHFGLFGNEAKTLREIASLKNLTHQRISQILKEAIKKIREKINLEELREYEYPELFEKRLLK